MAMVTRHPVEVTGTEPAEIALQGLTVRRPVRQITKWLWKSGRL